MCDCIRATQEAFDRQEMQLRLRYTTGMTTGQKRMVIATDKNRLPGRKGRINDIIIATFCPMCGEKYPEESA